jgi:uncharacterized membrane protein
VTSEPDPTAARPAQPDAPSKVLVGITLEDAYRAQELLVAVNRLAAKGRLHLLDAVVVLKNDDGHTHVKETIDPTPGRTAFSGAVWAGLFGLLLGGPVGWLAGTAVGAGAGAMTAKVIDLGIPDDWVEWFRAAVRPGTATLALLVSDLDVDALVAEARRFTGAELIYADLDDTTIERISEAFGSAPPPAEHRRDNSHGDPTDPSSDATGRPDEAASDRPPPGWTA